MKMRNALLLAAVALLVGGGVATAQSGGPVGYAVEPGTASGGDYQLTVLGTSTTGAMSGGEYHLQGGVQPMLRGNGCCCTYMPCILRQ